MGEPGAVVPAPAGTAASHGAEFGADARSALTGRWWKLDVVLALLDVDPHRPLLWLDDDLATEPEAAAWLAELEDIPG